MNAYLHNVIGVTNQICRNYIIEAGYANVANIALQNDQYASRICTNVRSNADKRENGANKTITITSEELMQAQVVTLRLMYMINRPLDLDSAELTEAVMTPVYTWYQQLLPSPVDNVEVYADNRDKRRWLETIENHLSLVKGHTTGLPLAYVIRPDPAGL